MTRKILATIGATLAIGVAGFVGITGADVKDLRGSGALGPSPQEQSATILPSRPTLELMMRSARL